jgi:putative flippase GtrA
MWATLKFAFGVEGEGKANEWQLSIANALGYGVGLITSFLLNRKWTFKSNRRWWSDLIKFIAGAMICYIPQLLLSLYLNNANWLHSLSFSLLGREIIISQSHISNMAGMVFYTILNFTYNKYYTFKK